MMSQSISVPLPLMVGGALALVACSTPALNAEERGSNESFVIESMQDGAPAELPEAVAITIENPPDGPRYFCTGVLLSARRVMTAAHCMGGTSFRVTAAHAPAPITVPARALGRVAESVAYEQEVWKEDIGFLTLDAPIALDVYPTIQAVGELGTQALPGVAVGRAWEDFEAPLVKSKLLSVTSGTPAGYETGLRTDYYSSGGDSGGPLFLADPRTKQALHVVIGVERQPEPPNEWFTRITPAVQALAGR